MKIDENHGTSIPVSGKIIKVSSTLYEIKNPPNESLYERVLGKMLKSTVKLQLIY